MTITQVAEYYSTYSDDKKIRDNIVTSDGIRRLYSLHQDEFDNDGVCVKSYKDFLIGNQFTLENLKGKIRLIYSSEMTLEILSRGIRIFPQRAILRVGMLLRDLIVAKEVRNQLLNIEEKASKKAMRKYMSKQSYMLQKDEEDEEYNVNQEICLRAFPHIKMRLGEIFEGVD